MRWRRRSPSKRPGPTTPPPSNRSARPTPRATNGSSRASKAKSKREKLDAAAAQFAKASTALKKALAQLRAVPQPAADQAKLTKWLGYVEDEAELFASAAKKLKAGDKVGAQAMVVRLSHNANLANNQVLAFDFDYCRFDTSKFT